MACKANCDGSELRSLTLFLKEIGCLDIYGFSRMHGEAVSTGIEDFEFILDKKKFGFIIFLTTSNLERYVKSKLFLNS